MSFKNKLFIFISAVFFASVVAANPCPDINDIKSQGLQIAEEISFGIYVSYSLSTFHTDATWGFFIAPIKADSANLAMETASSVLSTINAVGVPEQKGSRILCNYDTGNPFAIAAAVQDFNPNEMKQFLH